MLRCECGRNFGSRVNSNANCPKCTSKTTLTTVKIFSSPSKLREAVSLANVPREIASELSSRLATYEKSERSKQSLTSIDIDKILSHALLENKLITLNSIDESMVSLNLKKMSAEQLMEFLEASSMVLRNTDNSWSILQ